MIAASEQCTVRVLAVVKPAITDYAGTDLHAYVLQRTSH